MYNKNKSCAKCPFLIEGNVKESDSCSHKSSSTSGYVILESECNAGFPKKMSIAKR